jgi:hypothetical protein
MTRYCYCSKVLPGKEDTVRNHWKNKGDSWHEDEDSAGNRLWSATKQTDFQSWLQLTDYGNFYLHYLDAASFQGIFQGLREQIVAGNECALSVHSFYKEAFGKDYLDPSTEPRIECLLDISLPTVDSPNLLRRAFCWPLLDDKEEAHRHFREECRGVKRVRHEASMSAFGVSQLSSWLQTTAEGKFIITYSESLEPEKYYNQKAVLGIDSPEYQEISAILREHTGLSSEQLLPGIEWLTQPNLAGSLT